MRYKPLQITSGFVRASPTSGVVGYAPHAVPAKGGTPITQPSILLDIFMFEQWDIT